MFRPTTQATSSPVLAFPDPGHKHVLSTIAGALCVRDTAGSALTDPAQNIVRYPVNQAEHDVYYGSHYDHVDGHVSDEGHDAGHRIGLDPRDHGHKGRVDVTDDRLGKQHPSN
ncbi:hypothetical protein D9M70_556870 [compost metagenome]